MVAENSLFGQLPSDKVAEENQACRQIVREILNFGVNDRQLINIIYLLSLQVENIEVMQALTAAVKEISPESFLTEQGA